MMLWHGVVKGERGYVPPGASVTMYCELEWGREENGYGPEVVLDGVLRVHETVYLAQGDLLRLEEDQAPPVSVARMHRVLLAIETGRLTLDSLALLLNAGPPSVRAAFDAIGALPLR